MNDLSTAKTSIAVVLLSFGLLCTGLAQGGQSYSKTAELLCNEIKISVKTSCSDDSSPVYPKCQSQTFAFINAKTSKVVPQRSEQATTVNVSGVKVIDGLAESWACLKGKYRTYLVARYYNGGNCDECEWVEIYDLAGKHLTPNSRKDHSVFDARLVELGLSEDWKKSLIRIPLRRTEN